jgi:hypothetical protein
MQRFTLSLAAMALFALSLTGCCCSHLCGGGYGGACYPPAAAPCGPCGQTYGATYGAPAVMAPGGNCPSGNCGMYPSGAFYGPTAPIAAAGPAVYTTAALPLNPLPTY